MPKKKSTGSKQKSRTTSTKQLDQIIHEKTRLGIMTTLASKQDGVLFTDLKELNELTDGNLNRHLKVLSDAKLVEEPDHIGHLNERRVGIRVFGEVRLATPTIVRTNHSSRLR